MTHPIFYLANLPPHGRELYTITLKTTIRKAILKIHPWLKFSRGGEQGMYSTTLSALTTSATGFYEFLRRSALNLSTLTSHVTATVSNLYVNSCLSADKTGGSTGSEEGAGLDSTGFNLRNNALLQVTESTGTITSFAEMENVQCRLLQIHLL